MSLKVVQESFLKRFWRRIMAVLGISTVASVGLIGYGANHCFWDDSANFTSNCPGDVTNFVASPVGSDQLTLTWDDNAGDEGSGAEETGYEIEFSTDLGVSWLPLTTTTVDETAYADTGLLASTRFDYRIRAIDSGDLNRTSQWVVTNGTTGFVGSTNDLAWDAPTQLYDGTTITSEIVGYQPFCEVTPGSGNYAAAGPQIAAGTTNATITCAGKATVQVVYNNSITSRLALPTSFAWNYAAAICDYVLDPGTNDAAQKVAHQAVLDGTVGGEAVCFRGNAGEYRYDWGLDATGTAVPGSASATALRFRSGGTVANNVIVMTYPGDPRAKFHGPMLDNAYVQSEEAAQDDRPEPELQRLFDVTGANYQFHRLEVAGATHVNMQFACENNLINDIISHSAYANSNIQVGFNAGVGGLDCGAGDVIDFVAENVEASRSRHGLGFTIRVQTSIPYASRNVDGVTVKNLLLAANGKTEESGWLTNPSAVNGESGQGGGNADNNGTHGSGCEAGDDCVIRDQVFVNVYSYNPGDNHNDVVGGGVLTINNMVCVNDKNHNPGSSSGSGTGCLKNFTDESDEDVDMHYQQVAAFNVNAPGSLGSTTGFQFRTAGSNGAGFVDILHVGAIHLAGTKVFEVGGNITGANTTDHRFIGNVNDSEAGASIEFITNWLAQHNIDAPDTDARPGYAGRTTYNAPNPFTGICAGKDPRQLYECQYEDFLHNMMLTSSASNVVNIVPAGITERHDSKLADDPVSPADPESDLVACFGNQFAGDTSACDAGPIQFQYGPPATNLRIL